MGFEPSSSGRWGPPQPISLPGSSREYQSVDYHKNNLRNLRKMSKENGEVSVGGSRPRTRPMRALPPDPRTLMEANKKRYDHVQSKVSAWASTTSIPDSLCSTPKSPQKVRFKNLAPIWKSKISNTKLKQYSNFNMSFSTDEIQLSQRSRKNRAISSSIQTYST